MVDTHWVSEREGGEVRGGVRWFAVIVCVQVLDKFVPKITHDNDGLIFNPLEDVSHKFSKVCGCA